MKIEQQPVHNGNGVIVLIASDHMDASNVKAFKEAMQPLLAANDTVLIDMSQLTFVDSSGLGALLSCLRTMNNKAGQLKLFAMAKPVQALFELMRMHRIFAIYETREQALAAL
jgi:anti-sigma B factor antagonist